MTSVPHAYNFIFQVLWPAVTLACASCRVSTAVVTHVCAVRAFAPLVERDLRFSIVDSTMQITGLPPTALKFRAAVKMRIPRSSTSGALHGGRKPASCLSQFITSESVSCAGLAAISDCLWKTFSLTSITRRMSTGRQPEADAREQGVALLPAATAAPYADFPAKMPAFAPAQLLRSTASQRCRDGGLAMVAASRIARRWQPRAIQQRQCASEQRRSPAKQQTELAPRRSCSSRLLAPAACRPEGLPASCTTDQHLPVQDACTNVLVALGTIERVPAALQGGSGTVPPESTGDTRSTRVTAVRSMHDVESQSTGCRGSRFPFISAAKDCESCAVPEPTLNAHARMQRLGRRPWIQFSSFCNLTFRSCPMPSCPLRSDGGLAGLHEFPHDGASFATHRRDWEIHRATTPTTGNAGRSWDSSFVACSSSLTAAGVCPVAGTPFGCATSASAAEDATSKHAVRHFHSAVAAAQQPTIAAVPAQTRGRDFAEFLARAWAGPRGNTVARNLRRPLTAAAGIGWMKPFQTVLLPATRQQRRRAVCNFLPFLRTIGRKSFGLTHTQQYPSKQWLDGGVKRYFSASPLSPSNERCHMAVFSVYERQHCSKISSCTRILSNLLSNLDVPVYKNQTKDAPLFTEHLFPSLSRTGSGSAIACAAVAAASSSVIQIDAGAAPASAATATAALRSRTGIVAPDTTASGQTCLQGGELTKQPIPTTRFSLAAVRAGLTWLELDSALRRRHCTVTANGLELCGSASDGAHADTVLSARAPSSSGSLAAAAEIGQHLTNRKTLLSFDACTVRLPHPSKKDKGGEDASACTSRLLVVADGVGGWGMSGVDAGLYSRELVQRLRDIFEECCAGKHVQHQQQHRSGKSDSTAYEGTQSTGVKNSLSESTLGDVVFERTPDPVQLLKAAYLTTRAIGSSTCCLVVLDRLQKRVRCANIGDSGFILYRPSRDTIVARSNFQSHDFNFPLQLGTGSSDMPEHAHVLEVPVHEGDIFLLATDGLWDNLYDEQVLEIFRRGLDVRAAAGELSRLAFKCSQDPSWNSPFATKEKEVLGLPGRHVGGKPDDITVVVAILKESVSETTETHS